MLMEMIDTPDTRKEIHINSHELVTFKIIVVKSDSNIFRFSERYTRRKK